jgi:hypothetical protein
MSHVVMGRLLAWTCVIAGAATLFGLGLYLYSRSGWEKAANISTVVDMFAGLVALGLGIYGLISGPHAAQTSPESGRGDTATGSPNEIRDESAGMLVGEALAPRPVWHRRGCVAAKVCCGSCVARCGVPGDACKYFPVWVGSESRPPLFSCVAGSNGTPCARSGGFLPVMPRG